MKDDQIIKKISKLIKQYWQENNSRRKFIPGKTFIRYATAFYDEKELIAMNQAILKGWFGLSILGEQFENQLAKYIGSETAILTNSGSSASLLTMAALTNRLFTNHVPQGAEVITPACTFATTAAAIIQQGLTPVFVDVDLGTYNISPENIYKAISPKTKILFLPHTLGNPNEMDQVLQIAKKYSLYVVEDNCDALGSEYKGKKTGSFGILSTSSFYPAHHITLAGEGGAVLINDAKLYRIILSLRNWGRGCWCKSTEKSSLGACKHRFDFKIGDIPIDHKYYFITLGYNLKPVEIQAAMGIVQLKKFSRFRKIRKRNFDLLNNFFKKYQDFFILPESVRGASPCWFSYPLTIKDKTPFNRSGITQFLEKNLIETRTMFAGNFVRHPAMRDVNFRISGKLICSDKILRDTFFIGLGPHIGLPQIQYIQEIFTKFLNQY